MSRLGVDPVMLRDAIMHSVGVQLRALYDDVRVTVEHAAPCRDALRVQVLIRHRGREYGYAEEYAWYMFEDGGRFYGTYLRTEFPRHVAREVNDIIMRAAL